MPNPNTLKGEFVVDRKTGQVRHAGATTPAGDYVMQFKKRAEESLYVFAKGVLGLERLNVSLHREGAIWLQRIPPYRKLLLWPRDHLKTSIVGRALPIHILIQPPESNVYFPGMIKEGASTRVLLANETATNAEHQLRWIEARFESCDILKALWPHRCWDNARKQSRKWSEKEMIIPRTTDYPEASIETIGVGGAVTGRHYDVMIKDDLISIDAANSSAIMNTAINWHLASRALLDDPDKGLEFIIGTRWAVHDLYSEIIDTDDSVEVLIKSAIEDGQPVFPEMFTLQTLNRLAKELGPKFYLLYMNSAESSELTDLDMSKVRTFNISGEGIHFSEDERDLPLGDVETYETIPPEIRGLPLNKQTYDMVFRRNEYLRAKSS